MKITVLIQMIVINLNTMKIVQLNNIITVIIMMVNIEKLWMQMKNNVYPLVQIKRYIFQKHSLPNNKVKDIVQIIQNVARILN